MTKNRIKELREEQNETLIGLMRRVNSILAEQKTVINGKPLRVTDSQLSFYENGKRAPRNPEVWEAIARVFNVDVNYLLYTQKEPKRVPLSEYVNFLEESSELASILNTIWSEFIDRKGVESDERKKAVASFASILQHNKIEFDDELFSKTNDIIQTLNHITYEEIKNDEMTMKKID